MQQTKHQLCGYSLLVCAFFQFGHCRNVFDGGYDCKVVLFANNTFAKYTLNKSIQQTSVAYCLLYNNNSNKIVLSMLSIAASFYDGI